MGFLDFLFGHKPSKAEQAASLIEYGAFIVRLNQQAARLGVAKDQPFEYRLSLFLVFSAGFLRERAGMQDLSRDVDFNEAVAMDFLLMHGVRALSSRYYQDRFDEPEARQAISKIMTFVTGRAFGLDVENLDADPFAMRLMTTVNHAMKSAPELAPGLMDRMTDAWDRFFDDDEAGDDLAKIYLTTCDYVDRLMKRPATTEHSTK